MSKLNEERVGKTLRSTFNNLKGLQSAKGKYSRYDLECDTHIVECKYRNSMYDGRTLVEKLKYDANRQDGRVFIYAVTVGDYVYLFDFTNMDTDKFDWRLQKQPKTTYGDNTHIDKVVAYVPYDLAKCKVNLNSGIVIK